MFPKFFVKIKNKINFKISFLFYICFQRFHLKLIIYFKKIIICCKKFFNHFLSEISKKILKEARNN